MYMLVRLLASNCVFVVTGCVFTAVMASGATWYIPYASGVTCALATVADSDGLCIFSHAYQLGTG